MYFPSKQVIEQDLESQSSIQQKQKQTYIVPRLRDSDGAIQQQLPVMLTAEILEEHFELPLNEAAKQIGICETSLKRYAHKVLPRQFLLELFSSACRKIGIAKWPYRKANKNSTHVHEQTFC